MGKSHVKKKTKRVPKSGSQTETGNVEDDGNQKSTGRKVSSPGIAAASAGHSGTKKAKLQPPKKKKGRVKDRKNSQTEEFKLDEPGIKESLEICQGFSKLKIDDWYPFYDFQHVHRSKPTKEKPSTTAEFSNNDTEKPANDSEDDDEWEETLVYVDLEDIPDVDGLFSSLVGRSNADPNSEEESTTENGLLSHLEMKIFNMESELPVLLLGGKYLAGHWEDTIGTSLFFKKKSPEGDAEEEPFSPHASPSPATSVNGTKTKLENIVPKPDIPFDSVFGEKYISPENGYELVAKCVKVLKARHFPVVNDEVKGEEIIRDMDDEFGTRDFQIPPVSMVRQFIPEKLSYEKFMERDIQRRREIREKWATEDDQMKQVVKTEPIDPSEYENVSDEDNNDPQDTAM